MPFAGWEMPVQYEGVGAEHLAVRGGAGLFDVSHMGEIQTEGPGAFDLLQRLLTNDLTKLDVGGAQYSVLCQEDGGILDDLFTYRLADDRYLTVTNAANHERDLAWFTDHAGPFECEVSDRLADWAMLAVQGPEARGLVTSLAGGELPKRMQTAAIPVAGVESLLCGTGYTGEPGVEILCPPDGARALWDALVDAGATPAGLGARDTLRMEVCFHLYGNDMDTGRNPIEACLGWCCKEQTGFIGSEAVAQARAEGTDELLTPFVLTERGVPRQGNPVIDVDGERIGTVTSGTHSPSLQQGIGMAYVRREHAEPGAAFEIDVRGRRRQARAEERPLYKVPRDG